MAVAGVQRPLVDLTRLLVAAAFVERSSPSEAAGRAGVPLGNVAYHVRELLKEGMLLPDGEGRVRGAVQHFYVVDRERLSVEIAHVELAAEVARRALDPAHAPSEEQAVEVLYMRYGAPYIAEVESVEDALSYIESGEDDGQISSVGVFVGGEPRIWDGYVSKEVPTPEQAGTMRRLYEKARPAESRASAEPEGAGPSS